MPPKKQFVELKTFKALPYQKRVVDELADLLHKVFLLTSFRLTDAYKALGWAERARLRIQQACMQSYAQMLRQRLKAWGVQS